MGYHRGALNDLHGRSDIVQGHWPADSNKRRGLRPDNIAHAVTFCTVVAENGIVCFWSTSIFYQFVYCEGSNNLLLAVPPFYYGSPLSRHAQELLRLKSQYVRLNIAECGYRHAYIGKQSSLSMCRWSRRFSHILFSPRLRQLRLCA